MKISINWLKEFVNLDGISDEDIIKRFTLSTAEVENVEYKGKNTKGVVIGRVLSVNEHPNSKKLHILRVDSGKYGIKQCVCGAPNVREKMMVAFALSGSKVNGFEINSTEKAGVMSDGMCCSESELGIGENHDGIMDIVGDYTLGTDIKAIFAIEDTIFEIDNKSLTNRPDLWCHYGIAREMSVLFDRSLKRIETVNLRYYDNLAPIEIVNKRKDLCFRYSAIKIENISNFSSPVTMQIRLFYCGMRAINLMADLSNYLMLEIGQPMHTFDGEGIKKIVIDTAKDQQIFVTLDKVERTLNDSDLMIKDGKNNLAIAGVMGGLDSEITNDSKSVLLESATFESTTIRKTAQRLSLRSEASARYEKSLDAELSSVATARFIYLLKQIDHKISVASSYSDSYDYKYPQIAIEVPFKYIEGYIGKDVGEKFIINTLEKLGFVVQRILGGVKVIVPSYRATKDISICADIVEEIARIYGYNNIGETPMKYELKPVELNKEVEIELKTKQILCDKYNLNEYHSYIFKQAREDDEYGIVSPKGIKVVNSAVKENDEIRTKLLPSLLYAVADNCNALDDISIFEIGRTLLNEKNHQCEEKKMLGVCLGSRTKSEKELYFDLRDIVCGICEIILNRKVDFELSKVSDKNFHPKNNAKIFINSKYVGDIGIISPKISRKIDEKINIVAFELDFNLFVEQFKSKEKFTELTKYQTVNLDFNFICDKNVPYKNIYNYLNSFNSDLDYKIKLKDRYENKAIDNKVSYTFSFEISSLTHTLTSEEINQFSQKLIQYAEKNNYTLKQ